MRKNINKKKMIIAVTIAFFVTILSYASFNGMSKQLAQQKQLIQQMQLRDGGNGAETFTYAVATKDLKAGELVSDADIEFKDFDSKQPDAFDARSAVVNRVLLADIKAGETFTSYHIAKVSNDSIALRPGYRALTLPADNFQGKSKKMTDGTVVDVYSSASDSPWKLEGVRIVSFDSSSATATQGSSSDSSSSSSSSKPANSAPDITTATSITFEVATNDISAFISNASKSKLMLVERNPNDKTIHHSKPAPAQNYDMAYSTPVAPQNYSYPKKKSYKSSGGGSIPSSLPYLPSSVPIKNLGGGSGLSGLPQPSRPRISHSPSTVEMIQANQKSTVTFN
ncbi:hypothetical protein KBA27_05180 [bacterium]|nr:hypothetical protein [bacterium]